MSPRSRPGAAVLWLAPWLAGCGGALAPPDLVAVTAWPHARRAAFEAELAASDLRPLIRWIEIAPGDGPARIARKAETADVAIGVSPSVLAALASRGRLADEPARDLGGLPLGFEAEAGTTPPSDWAEAGAPAFRDRLALGDPRIDWIVFSAISAGLGTDPDSEGYAPLVLAAGNARRGGPAPVSAALGIDGPTGEGGTFRALPGRPTARDLAAPLKDARRSEAVRRVLDRYEAAASAVSPSAASLVAELLGATLFDARGELRRALAALEQTTDPARRETLTGHLTEPPPWPPASIQKIRERPTGDELLAALASEIVDDRPAREWLLARWREPDRPVDVAFLNRLAEAEGGKLAAEPRYLAWLRAEWAAWAEQRYRRVVRAASGGFSP